MRSELSSRKPEATSVVRIMDFNKVVVDQFDELFEGLLDSYKLSPDHIFSYDKTSVSSVPKCKSKIILP